jgi:hypothetical protein
MSRGYVINWVTVRNTIQAGDKIEIAVELLGIIADGDMTALLRQELEQDGWTARKDGTMELVRDGIRATLNREATKIAVTLERKREIVARGVTDAEAKKSLDTTSAAAEERLKEEIAKELTRAETDIRAGVDQAIQRVYLEALKKKAASIGTIEGMQESRRDDGEYEITIKVRV